MGASSNAIAGHEHMSIVQDLGFLDSVVGQRSTETVSWWKRWPARLRQ